MKYLTIIILLVLAVACQEEKSLSDTEKVPTIHEVWQQAALIYEKHGLDSKHLSINRSWYDSIVEHNLEVNWGLVEDEILAKKALLLQLQEVDETELRDPLPAALKEKLKEGFASEEEYNSYKKQYPRYME